MPKRSFEELELDNSNPEKLAKILDNLKSKVRKYNNMLNNITIQTNKKQEEFNSIKEGISDKEKLCEEFTIKNRIICKKMATTQETISNIDKIVNNSGRSIIIKKIVDDKCKYMSYKIKALKLEISTIEEKINKNNELANSMHKKLLNNIEKNISECKVTLDKIKDLKTKQNEIETEIEIQSIYTENSSLDHSLKTLISQHEYLKKEYRKLKDKCKTKLNIKDNESEYMKKYEKLSDEYDELFAKYCELSDDDLVRSYDVIDVYKKSLSDECHFETKYNALMIEHDIIVKKADDFEAKYKVLSALYNITKNKADDFELKYNTLKLECKQVEKAS